MAAPAILVHEGLAHDGGVTVDVRHLADRLGLPAVATLGELRRELGRSPDALVHVFGCLPSATTFGAFAVAKRAHRRLVWTPIFNPIRPRTWRGYGAARPPMEVFDRLAPRAARFCDAVIAATDAERTFFARWTRAETIPPGVDDPGPPRDPGDVAAFRARFGLEGDILVTVARDNSRKALPFGLAVHERLRRDRPVRLLLVGPDRDHPYGLRDGVVVAGWLARDEVELALAAADLLWVPSLYEGLPRAVIEAWRGGLPCAVTDRVALAPLVRESGGAVVPYGDVDAGAREIAALLDDAARRDRASAAGRELVAKRFALSVVVPETVRLYEEVRA